MRFFFSRKETFRQRRQRGGVLLIPGLDATFAVNGSPDWMAVTKDAVWVASSSVNHVVRLDAKTNQPGTIVTVAKPCAGLVVGFGSLWIPSCGDHTVVRLTSARRFVGEGEAVAPSQNHNGRLRQGVCEVPQSNFRSLRPTALSENDFEHPFIA